MRILFASYAYPNESQPRLATFNRAMLAGLAERHDVRVIAPIPFVQQARRRWNGLKQSLRGDAKRAVATNGRTADAGRSRVQVQHPTFYYTPRAFHEHYDRFLWWSVRGTLRRAVNDFRPDVILSYWAHPDGAVAVRLGRETGIPAVVMVGGSDVLLLARRGPRRRAILNALHGAAKVIAVSEHLAEVLRDDGLPAERVAVVPRGIDDSLFHPGHPQAARRELGLPLDRPVLMGVGRLVDVKDWPTWIDTCGELARRGLRPSCHIFGEGPLEAALRARIVERGLTDIVHLHGSASPETLARWYRAADLTVLSSRSEGIPNVLLEALASGGSFVATDVGGIPEIADPIYDRLVPPSHPVALADAIIDRLRHAPPSNLERRFSPATQSTTALRLTQILEQARRGTLHALAPAAVTSPPEPVLTAQRS